MQTTFMTNIKSNSKTKQEKKITKNKPANGRTMPSGA